MSSMTTLITGASRGLGLEFASQYLAAGHKVIATARTPDNCETLASLKCQYPEQLSVFPLDVTDNSSIKTLAEALAETPIDLLINNAGIYGPSHHTVTSNNLDIAAWQKVLTTNTIAPLLVSSALLPVLRAGTQKKMVFISSSYGSIAQAASEGSYYYRSSKTALNMAVKKLSLELADEGFICICQNPGWVQTDMGGEHADLTPERSVQYMRQVIDNLKPEHNGQFFDYTGKELPW